MPVVHISAPILRDARDGTAYMENRFFFLNDEGSKMQCDRPKHVKCQDSGGSTRGNRIPRSSRGAQNQILGIRLQMAGQQAFHIWRTGASDNRDKRNSIYRKSILLPERRRFQNAVRPRAKHVICQNAATGVHVIVNYLQSRSPRGVQKLKAGLLETKWSPNLMPVSL
jgi:hypothetical protein